ncbi:MAG TPA: hypothetical protein VIJ57_01415, partial [Hanamia sp.]
YQPPLLGYKQLLNFGAYSIPDIGGLLFILVGMVLLVALVVPWYKKRKSISRNQEDKPTVIPITPTEIPVTNVH